MLWFFWLFVLLGGWGMGLGALRVGLRDGFAVATALNAAVWLGCGLYATPRVWRLARRGHRPAAH